MVCARFPVRRIAPLLLLVSALVRPGVSLAQSKSLFPNSQVPAQSEALRRPARRPPPPPRPDTVALPYNLVWGDTQNRLASLFAGVGAKVLNKKAQGPSEVWTVQGLIAPNLQSSLFTFGQGNLVALEFDYGQPDWTVEKYNDFMGQFRRLLEAKCEKPGEMISRDTAQPAGGTVKQSLMGYQWKRGDTMVQLFYFSAEDSAKGLVFRSISVHYLYQEIVPENVPLPEAGANADPNASVLFGGAKKPSGPTPAPSPEYGPPPPPTPSPKPGNRDSDPLPER